MGHFSSFRNASKTFVKNWMLIIGIIAGISIYLIYHSIPALAPAGPILYKACSVIQPALLFMMLFLSFCKVSPSQLRPHKWQLWLLLLQGCLFVAIVVMLLWAGKSDSAAASLIVRWRIPIEAAMLCLICPTATACAVVTGKLGGSMAGVITYTVMVNLLVAILIPAFLPLLFPKEGLTFMTAFGTILAKVFPLLMMPCVCAWLIRFLLPEVHSVLEKFAHFSFYLWAVALTLAIIMSTRAIVHSGSGFSVLAGIAIASLFTCAFQFWAGKKIGSKYDSTISAGQALGQKNTVFAIWVGYTFMDPIVSVAGGFYSLWHNCYNTWQLNRKRKSSAEKK